MYEVVDQQSTKWIKFNKSQECFFHRYRTASRAGIGDILPTSGDGASTHALGSVR